MKIDKKWYKLHRIVAMVYLGLDISDKTQEIDHINRIKTDNRIENIRIVSRMENQWNKDYKGYYQRENGNYTAQIQTDGKLKSKTFKTESEAIDWRNEMEIIYHTILR